MRGYWLVCPLCRFCDYVLADDFIASD